MTQKSLGTENKIPAVPKCYGDRKNENKEISCPCYWDNQCKYATDQKEIAERLKNGKV